MLSPFNEAPIELSVENKVSASKVIPMMNMLNLTIGEQVQRKQITIAKQLTEHLYRQLREKLNQFQSMSILTYQLCWTQGSNHLAFSAQPRPMKRCTD